MKRFFAVVIAVLIFLSSSVLGFAIVVPVDEKHFLYAFDVGGGNIVLPLNSDLIHSLAEDKKEILNTLLGLMNDPSYITIFSFTTPTSGEFNGQVAVIPKDSYYFFTTVSLGMTSYNAGSNNKPFYRASFRYYKATKLFTITPYDIAQPSNTYGIPLRNSTFSGGCFSTSVSYAEHDVIKFLDINSITFSGYQPPATGYTLTVNYLYAEGVPAADPVTGTVAAGEEYSIPSPEIAGYTPSIPLVAGTMPEKDLTIDVYYSKAFYPLTVRYRYQDGTQAAPDVVQQYPAGFFYDIPSPKITGYQPDKATVTGTMPGNALEEVVTYTGKPYTLTVDYLHEDGSLAAPSHTERLITGTPYSVPSPEIEGYTPSTAAVTGVMPGADKRIVVTYRRASAGSSDAGSSGSGSSGSSGGDDGPSGPGSSSGGGIPPFSGSDPFEMDGKLPAYTQDPFASPKEPPESEYLAFSPEYLYHVGSMLRENIGIVTGVGLYAFLAVLAIYTTLHVIDIFQ